MQPSIKGTIATVNERDTRLQARVNNALFVLKNLPKFYDEGNVFNMFVTKKNTQSVLMGTPI